MQIRNVRNAKDESVCSRVWEGMEEAEEDWHIGRGRVSLICCIKHINTQIYADRACSPLF